MTLLGFAWSNLARRPMRTLLTVLGIGLAIATAVTLIALSRGIADSASRGLGERGTELVVTPRNASDIMSASLPAAMASKIAGLPGVASVAGELYAFTITRDSHQVLVGGLSPDAPDWQTMPLLEGRLPQNGERAVVAGDLLLSTLKAKIGDRVILFDLDFTIVGVSGYSAFINRGVAFTPLAVLQQATFREAQVSFLSVRLAPGLNGSEEARLRQKIAGESALLVSDSEELLDHDRNLAVLEAVSTAVSIVALAMGGLQLFGAMLLSVQERTREIGMLAAVGWSDSRIVAALALEAIMIAAAGSSVGTALGVAASPLFALLPALGGLVEFRPTLEDLKLPILAAIVITLLGSVIPAWRATQVAPAEALRRP